jgi:hypothetical protein
LPDFLTAPLASAPIPPLEVGLRLLIALALGAIVAWVYRHTREDSEIMASFPPTLVLLAVLIAMVTQVIGDNIARAFSLVGALSIVRFRTVVRDTQDTAFVIFAVVVGMASGAASPWVAIMGIGVVGAAAFLMRPRKSSSSTPSQPFTLKLRLGLGHDLNGQVGGVLDAHVVDRRLLSIGTAKQGIALDVAYEGRLRKDSSPEDLVKALNRVEGVQNVEWVVPSTTPEPF